jgi:predicted secreted hydrolase
MRVERTVWLAVVLLLAACGDDIGTQPNVAGQLRLGAVLGEAGTFAGNGDYAVADRVRSFEFPADHGAHPEFKSEWWYLTLVLEDQTGAPFGVQFTLFRQALTPVSTGSENRWLTDQAYLAHFAITDVRDAQHHVDERFARGHPSLAGVVAEPFRLWLEDWRIEAEHGAWRFRAGMPEARVDLTLDMSVEPVLQGDAGLSRKGEGQASYYFSIPGIPVSGRIVVDGREYTVSGLGWFDREWSTSVLGEEQLGWDWFALQLRDGRKVMMFQLRRRDGSRDPFDQGVVIGETGQRRVLGTADFDLTPRRFWTDSDGASWPVGWEIRLGDERWRVEAAVDDQRMETTLDYWEGLVDVYDAAEDAPIGRGYLELTGYDRRSGQAAAAARSADDEHR